MKDLLDINIFTEDMSTDNMFTIGTFIEGSDDNLFNLDIFPDDHFNEGYNSNLGDIIDDKLAKGIPLNHEESNVLTHFISKMKKNFMNPSKGQITPEQKGRFNRLVREILAENKARKPITEADLEKRANAVYESFELWAIDDSFLEMQNYDNMSIPVPSSKEIPLDVYNQAITALKKSFKEAMDVCGWLENTKPVEVTTDQLQEEYAEQVIWDSYCDGPYFEAVKDPNKSKIKKVAKVLRGHVAKMFAQFTKADGERDKDGNVRDPRTKDNKYGLTVHGIGSEKLISDKNVQLKAWQLVGAVLLGKKDTESAAAKYYTGKFKEDLGDLVLKVHKISRESPVEGVTAVGLLTVNAPS